MSTSGLFGGGAAGDAEKKKAEDFINRYQTGKPTEGYTEQEALEQLQQVAKVATPEQMQAAFQASVNNLPADERAQFNQMLQDRKAGTGMIDIERSGDRQAVESRSSDSGGSSDLGDILGQVLGGSTGGSSSSGGGLGDILGQILGGGSTSSSTSSSGGGLGDILGQVLGGASGATAAPAQTSSNDSGGGITDMLGGLLSSPIGKAVLAGTAAYAMKEVLGK